MASRLSPPTQQPGKDKMPRERKVLLTLIAAGVLIAGFLVFQIVSEQWDDIQKKEKSTNRDRIDSTTTPEVTPTIPASVEDPVDQTNVDPDPAAVTAGNSYVATFYNMELRQQDPQKWRRDLEPYCDPKHCDELLSYRPIEAEPVSVTGGPSVDESKPAYLVLAYPADNAATIVIYVGTTDNGWRVYSHDVEWR